MIPPSMLTTSNALPPDVLAGLPRELVASINSTLKVQLKIVDVFAHPSVRARAALVEGKNDFTSVTNTIARVAEAKTPKGWYLMFGVAIALLLNLGAMIGYLVFNGIGVWGNNIPVGWGWPIVNFVFWIGIGHAGTLISAVLFLFRQKWRTSINRFAEAM
jgi:molybdopterin-containing oxidoreductase family membrane subunit